MKKCIACILSIIIIVSQFSFNMVSAEEINKNALMVVESYSEQNYTVEREDRSIKSSDNSGKVLLEYYYDKVVLNSTDANAVKINRLMQQECEAFFEDDMSWCSENPPMYENEYYVKSAQGIVTKNANGIFSIKYCSSWYMGGVYNINYNGLNYNLKDGSVLKITDLFSMSDNEVLNYIKTETKEYIDQHPDMNSSKSYQYVIGNPDIQWKSYGLGALEKDIPMPKKPVLKPLMFKKTKQRLADEFNRAIQWYWKEEKAKEEYIKWLPKKDLDKYLKDKEPDEEVERALNSFYDEILEEGRNKVLKKAGERAKSQSTDNNSNRSYSDNRVSYKSYEEDVRETKRHQFSFVDAEGNYRRWGDGFIDCKGNYVRWGGTFVDGAGNYVNWGNSFVDGSGSYRRWGDDFVDGAGNYVRVP